jgi:hypothetical protein
MNNSSAVLKTINKLGRIPKAQKELFTALVEDNQKMEERIAKVEDKVDKVIVEQQAQRVSIDRLSELVKASINQKESTLNLLKMLFSNKWFWFWFIVFTIVVGGGSVAELASIVHIGG